jgi:hypothetical protein
MTDQKTAWSRRSFLQSALGTGAGFALAGPFTAGVTVTHEDLRL